MNERFAALATKLYEFIGTMKEQTAEIRAENIRRDDAVRLEIHEVKRQHTEDIAAIRQEYDRDLKTLNETVFMLKGAVALVYLLAALVSIWAKFGG